MGQQVFDQFLHLLGAGDDEAVEFSGLGFGAGAAVFLQQLAGGQNPPQGSVHVVGGHGGELLEVLVGPFEFGHRLPRLVLGAFSAAHVPVKPLDADRSAQMVADEEFQDLDVNHLAPGLVLFDVAEDFARLDHPPVVGSVFSGLFEGKDVEDGLAEELFQRAADVLQIRRVAKRQSALQVDPVHADGNVLDEREIQGFRVLKRRGDRASRWAGARIGSAHQVVHHDRRLPLHSVRPRGEIAANRARCSLAIPLPALAALEKGVASNRDCRPAGMARQPIGARLS